MDEIICTLEREGFRAHYYPGTKKTEKAVIFAGGADCDEKTCIAMAGYLRKDGWNVLVLGFYLWEGLSRELVSIPVDYVEKAVKWLKNEQHIEKIAMTGVSTGGTYTMLSASLIPEITCAIPVVPYDYIMEGTKKLKRCRCSEFTWHGKDIPYNPGNYMDGGTFAGFKMAIKTKGYGINRFLRFSFDLSEGLIPDESLTSKERNKTGYKCGVTAPIPESRIKTENMNADVLILASENDDCWPSERATRRIVKVLEENSYEKRVEWHIYEKGSHLLVDGYDDVNFVTRFLVKQMITAEKKYPKECEEARKDSCRRILKFLNEW